MKEHKALPPQFFKPVVSGWFFLLSVFRSRKKSEKYGRTFKKQIEILEKDEYDTKFGFMLEYGIEKPYEYYLLKKTVIENGLAF